MHIAVVGCGHGEIDKIYEVVDHIEKERGIKVSLLLCCGDFQSVRNMTDLRCMACPIKYQHMHDFHRYYSGEKQAPVLTMFIGGNHEASNYLQELPYGGWVAPNIFYMGYTGVYRFGGVKIAGISGIYKGQDYLKGRYEGPPYDQGTMRSVYHYRNIDIFRLKQLHQPVDVVLSHDWPKGIHQFGNVHKLLRRKPFFREEIERNELGSRPLFEVLERVKPKLWFAAHMHVKFAALVNHPDVSIDKVENDEDNSATQKSENKEEAKITKFLALDKVLPRRQFLQIIEIPSEDAESDNSSPSLEYDPEWLTILRNTNHLVSTKPKTCFMPGPGGNSRYDFSPSEDEISEVSELFGNNFKIPLDFEQTASPYGPGDAPSRAVPSENPQTKLFCQRLGVTDPLQEILDSSFRNPLLGELKTEQSLDFVTFNSASSFHDTPDMSGNPDEISLDLDEDATDSASVQEDHMKAGESSRRNKLVLPPPKTEGESNDKSAAGSGGMKDLEILQSVLGNAEEDLVGASFFIDTTGREASDEPSHKRKKNLESFRY